VSERVDTVRLADVVYADPPALDDPAEVYHEASKVSPVTAGRELAGVARLAATPELQASAARAVRRHPLLPAVALAPAAPLSAELGTVLARRRSERTFASDPIAAAELAALLAAGYGVTGALELEDGHAQPMRTAPSGGALYPLELFAAVRNVDGLPAGLYHYDALEDMLERLADGPADLSKVSPFESAVAGAAVVVALAACFWRSRFKYGLRAYRFTLLEAGHVAQNLLLAAAALELGAVPIGGFYDRRLDDLLGLDGVDESSLYLVCVGRPHVDR